MLQIHQEYLLKMMAAGLPVVELYRENNLYDLPDEGVLLAEPTPESIASAIIYLIDNPTECEKMSAFGQKYMKDYPLEKGFGQFLNAVKDMLETDYNKDSKLEKLYKKQPFKATEEAKRVSLEDVKKEEIYQDQHGRIYRFLRRVKRFLKRILKKQ